MSGKWKFDQVKVFLPHRIDGVRITRRPLLLFDSTPNVAEVVVKRDRNRCWDVMKNMKHQGLPPNNVTCRTSCVNGDGW